MIPAYMEMQLLNKILCGLAVYALSATLALAENEDRVYAGLVWDLGQSASFVPSVIAGVRTLHLNNGSSLDGADLSVRITLKDGVALDSSRLVYVGGERDLMGNVGVGYSFVNKSVLATVAIQGPYTRAGVDYELQNATVRPYVEVNTLDRPKSGVGSVTVATTPHPS